MMPRHYSSITAGGECIDIVGTGGDCIDTFNASTAAAFVIAGAGGMSHIQVHAKYQIDE